MAAGLLLLLFCLNGLVWSEDQRPEVDCVVVNLDYVHCVWNGSTPPDFNYTFYSRFDGAFNPCARYVLDNSTVMGCDQRYEKLILKRLERFTTRLELGNRSFEQNHQLKSKEHGRAAEDVLLHQPSLQQPPLRAAGAEQHRRELRSLRLE
ncbi:hypothetical protein NHX12_025934 [Muraenolepis orangiensis]|uniref:Cytokine receptor-like factor 2-like D1 domain-containing protein n=1 Tax=Muraenolepis orangiensis TaxID=630683 RepID=A0A9Q0EHJ9_9TELE|nr:hypothetical protein NHX12_025934 [Muraenolepis orangiensis]